MRVLEEIHNQEEPMACLLLIREMEGVTRIRVHDGYFRDKKKVLSDPDSNKLDIQVNKENSGGQSI